MWCTELPPLSDLAPGPHLMFGEQWLQTGAHRYQIHTRLNVASPFGALSDAARRLGGSAEWNKSAGWLNLSGNGWRGFAALRGGADLAVGEYVELIVELQGDPIRAQEAAKALARRTDALAPFADLAEMHGALIEISSRMQFSDALFGYVGFGKPGFRAFLAADLDGWLAACGFERQAGGDEVYTRGHAPAIWITRGGPASDSLRVDVAGLADFLARPVAPRVPSHAPPPPAMPYPADAFARAQCVCAVFQRMSFEQAWKTSAPPDRAKLTELNTTMLSWLEAERLLPALTPTERPLLLSPLGAWSRPTFLDASWWMEAAGVLAWALGHVDALPAYDRQFDVDAFTAAFPMLEPIAERVASARLRSVDVLAPAREIAEAEEAKVERGSEAWSIASERKRALDWLCGVGAWS